MYGIEFDIPRSPNGQSKLRHGEHFRLTCITCSIWFTELALPFFEIPLCSIFAATLSLERRRGHLKPISFPLHVLPLCCTRSLMVDCPQQPQRAAGLSHLRVGSETPFHSPLNNSYTYRYNSRHLIPGALENLQLVTRGW